MARSPPSARDPRSSSSHAHAPRPGRTSCRDELTAIRAELEEHLQHAQTLDQLDGAIAAERARSEELEQSRARAETRADELQDQLTAIRAELEEHLQHAQTLDQLDDAIAAERARSEELEQSRARAETRASELQDQLTAIRAELEEHLQHAQTLDQLDDAIAAERARSEELEQSRARAEARASELQDELTAIRAELEEHLQHAQTLDQLDDAIATERARSEELEQSRARAEARADELQDELTAIRAELEEHLQHAQTLDQLDDAIATERARSEELEQSRARAETRADELQDELTAIRAELEEHLQHAQTLDQLDDAIATERARSEESNGLKWSAGSQRAISAALVGLTEWDSVLKHAVSTLGSEGGWDATIAWCPDEPRGSMTCSATWMRDPAGLGPFETRTWKHREDASTAEFGRARNRMATTCLLELQSAESPLLRAAAAAGMGSALLVPISDGDETIAMLELLSRTATAPNAELMVSIEAIALQLGAIAQLLKLADVPRWRMGRL